MTAAVTAASARGFCLQGRPSLLFGDTCDPFNRRLLLVSIAAVIPARNSERWIRRCLDSLSGGTDRPDEIIVVDDASTDGTGREARECGARVIELEVRQGPARARNAGAAAAAAEVILFVDSDVLVPPGLVERIRLAFEDPSVAAVQTMYTPSCPATDLVSSYQNFYYHLALASIRGDRSAVFATWCAAVRKEVFTALGGFNEDIPDPTVEDEELGYSMSDAGYSILLERDMQVTHLACYTVLSFARRRFRMAASQARSAWRSVRSRLLLRYVNLRNTGTHHSRLTVLAILCMLLSQASLAAWTVSLFSGGERLPFLPAAVFMSASALILCSRFLRSSVNSLGVNVLIPFAALCLLDLLVLGWGVVWGTLGFLARRRY